LVQGGALAEHLAAAHLSDLPLALDHQSECCPPTLSDFDYLAESIFDQALLLEPFC